MRKVSSWKIEVIRIFDFIASSLLKPARSIRGIKKIKSSHARSRSILIIRPGGMGDLICLVEAMRRDKINYEGFTFLIEPRSAAFATRIGLNFKTFRELRSVRNESFSLIIDSEQRYGTSRLVAKYIADPTTKICGFESNLSSHHTDILASGWNEIDHAVAQFQRLMRTAMHTDNNLFRFTEGVTVDNDELLGEVVRKPNRGNCFWYSGGANRSRRVDSTVLDSLLDVHDCESLLISELEFAQLEGETLEILKKKNRDLIVAKSLEEALEVAQEFEQIVTIDGGAVHLASFFGLRVIAYFTSGNSRVWAPWSDGSVFFRSEQTCAPCNKWGRVPPCGNNFNCTQLGKSST